MVREILLRNGIPSCTGTAMGYSKVDLMAWARVPIEAKAARPSGPDKFVWKFSPGQLEKLQGLIFFVADYREWRRCFIIPVEAIRLSIKMRADRIAGFSLTLGSEHGNSQWETFRHYEDRFDLIEIERQKFGSTESISR